MKFLLDSCISGFAAKELRNAGFDILWIPEAGKDPGDEEIIKKAFEEDRILITADKDFGELVFLFNKPHSTIVRLVDIPAKKQGKTILRLIETHKTDIDKRALITVESYRVRVRLTESS